jgi:phage terminase large subunit
VSDIPPLPRSDAPKSEKMKVYQARNRAKKAVSQNAKEEELFKKYALMGQAAGCAPGQMMNFWKAGVILQAHQLKFCAAAREADKPDGPKNLLAGGGRGSGKSQGIFAQIWCDDCQRMPGSKWLMLRKVGQANKEQVSDFVTKLLVNVPHKYKESAPSKVEFPNGSFVNLGHFKDEKDIDSYLGLEYDGIYIMESNQLTATKKANIISCLRTNKTNWRTRIYQDTNPGGIDHTGNKRLFIDGRWAWDDKLETYVKIGVETETRYVHSTVNDNAFVDKDYKTNVLEKYVGWQRQAWLYGNWEFMAGAFFSNFHRDTHVYPNAQTDLNERSVVRWFAGLDYGYSHPNAFTLFCEDEGGNIFVVAEYSATNTLIEEHAANIRDLLRLHNLEVEDLEFIAAGRDCFRVDKDGSTVATEYRERGILMTPVHIDRVNAWSQVAEVFGDVEHQIRPRCFIHKNCQNLIVQIESAQSDPKKPNDVLKQNADPETGENGDDQLESFRNGIVMAYTTLMKSAMPVKFGEFKSMSESSRGGFQEVDAVILQAEENEALRRHERGPVGDSTCDKSVLGLSVVK